MINILSSLPTEIIVVLIVLGLMLISFFGLLFLARKIRSMVFNKRYDDNNTLKYFYASDFENLIAEPIEFNSKGNKIVGYIYKDSAKEDYKGVIVFSHGLGVGHNQYTTEIDHFAKLGFIVVSYDVSGTGKSEGKTIKGLTTALYNLKDALEFVENHPLLSKYKKMVVGHSMGAYSANNVTRYNQNLVGVVSMAGFDTTYGLLSEEIGLINGTEIKILRKIFKMLEHLEFGKDGLLSSLDAFKETDIKHLLVAGTKDNIVDTTKNFERFKLELEGKNNFEYLLVEDRYHRPNISLAAAAYDQETNMELNRLKSEFKNKIPENITRKYYDSLDYKLLVELDDEVMGKIDEFILDCFN